MAYIIPLHQASGVHNAIKLQFLQPGEDCLVVAKSNRLEFYTQTSDGLALQHAKAIYGKITVLQKISRSHRTDLLFVGTDRYTYFTLSWDPKSNRLHTEQKYVDISDPSLKDSQSGDRSWVDPSGNFLTMELYEGVITVIPISQEPEPPKRQAVPDSRHSEGHNYLGDPHQARVDELTVRSTAFLHRNKSESPRLAILYENIQGKVKLKLRELVFNRAIATGEASSVELKTVDELEDDLELGADLLVPIPSPLGGALILGERFIKYIDTVRNETITLPLEYNTVFVAWEQLDSQRWLFADDYGRLFFSMLILDSSHVVQSWKVDLLGETSRASVLVHLGSGVVFLGSHQGDSHVIRITEGSFDIIQTFSNIAPILDFTVMDLGHRGESLTHEFSSGQARLVTGSGAFHDGSLRSVRSGVGMEDLGVLGTMEHITDLWGLSAFCSEPFCDTLLVTFVDESRIFYFSADGEVEEKESFLGLQLGEPTIYASNLANHRLLQITDRSAKVTDIESGVALWEWSPIEGEKITAASANEQDMALIVDGQELVVFDISHEILRSGAKKFESERQVSGVALAPMPARACILCFPQQGEISIVQLDDLAIRHTESLGEPGEAIPRSVTIANVVPNSLPTSFVSMADGSIFSFSVDLSSYTLLNTNKLVLGSEAPMFKLLLRDDGLVNIFATCDHPTLIYSSENRIVYSAVNSDKATRICHFNAEAYPGAVAVATPDDLKLALVDTERTTQIQTLRINETVRRVAYSPAERAFGLGTIQRTLVQNVEEIKSHFILADEILFRQLSVFDLLPNELVECAIRTEHPTFPGQQNHTRPKDIFLVGTSVMDTPETGEDRKKSRIIIFDVDANRELRKLSEIPVRGACRALGMVNGRIVAALMKTVVVFSMKVNNAQKIDIEKEASYRTSTGPVDLSVRNNFIAIADMMKSISLVEHRPGENGRCDSLVEVSRHYQTLWTTATASTADNEFLVADAEGNLVVLRRNITGLTEDDRRRLQVSSEIHLGQMVNRIHSIDLQMSSSSPVIPRAFLATVDGSIYLFCSISQSSQDLLMRLQSALASLVTSPGEIPFNGYRAFKNNARRADEPFRFVDGELIEKFLDCSHDIQEAVMDKLGGAQGLLGLSQLRGIIEGLKRMH